MIANSRNAINAEQAEATCITKQSVSVGACLRVSQSL